MGLLSEGQEVTKGGREAEQAGSARQPRGCHTPGTGAVQWQRDCDTAPAQPSPAGPAQLGAKPD